MMIVQVEERRGGSEGLCTHTIEGVQLDMKAMQVIIPPSHSPPRILGCIVADAGRVMIPLPDTLTIGPPHVTLEVSAETLLKEGASSGRRKGGERGGGEHTDSIIIVTLVINHDTIIHPCTPTLIIHETSCSYMCCVPLH